MTRLVFDDFKSTTTHLLIAVDVGGVMRYWREHGIYQRSPTVASYRHDLPWDVDTARIDRILQAAKASITLPPVDISLSEGRWKGVCFPDGRHRFCVAALLGMESVPARVRRQDAELIQAYLSPEAALAFGSN